MRRNDFGYVDPILTHSTGLANAAQGNLDAPVEHCPGWSVADLVWHVTEVHRFWRTIVEERLSAPPKADRRPPRPADDKLIATFEAGAAELGDVLHRTPYRDRVWTWAPAQQDIGFIARHQVQEAAVHHFDAARAAGSEWSIEPVVAADCIDEFLTFSVASDDDAADPPLPALGGSFVLRAADTDAAWTVTDGDSPGAARTGDGAADDLAGITATAGDLLLWLYGRKELDTSGVDSDLLDRFRVLSDTA